VLHGFGDIIPVRSGTYTSTGDLLAFFAGPNGSAPGGYVLQYHFATFDLMEQPTGGSPDQLTVPKNFVNQYVLSNFSTYSTVAAVDLATPPTGFGPSILAQIAAPNGSIVADAILPPTDFGPQSTTTPAAQAVQLVLTEVGLVSLVIGILGGIALYGSDRLSGALEPYLARPITPEGFVGARYVGLLLPLLGGVIAGLLVADAALSVRYGAAMPPALLAVAIASAAGGLAAWIGVPIALSHVTRSQIRLLTYALGIVVVFGFFWTPALISIGPWVGAGPGTLAGATLDFDAQMFNPALAPSTLVIPALLGTGLATVAGIVVDLAVWGILPIGFALWWTRRRD
jgi:ABC-type transport system involved in multi-copper enzyme maturation permease subunit